MKPDYGAGIVLFKATKYYAWVEKLFSNKSKLKQIMEDPTPTWLTSLQRYPKQLNNRREFSIDVSNGCYNS